MEASTVKYILKDVAPKLISPDPVERNSSLNAYVADLAHLSSPWATAEGITEIKQLSEAWGSARLRGEVESVEYDKDSQVATITSKQTYTIPVIHLLKFTTHSTTTLHLNQEDEEPLLLITSIEESDGVGALLKKLPVIPRLLPALVTPLLVLIGSILLAHSHHVAQMSTLSSALPVSDPVKAVMHPVKTAKSLLSIFILSALSILGAAVGAWQNNVGDKYTLGVDLNFKAIDAGSDSSSSTHASNPKKRSHTHTTEEPTASSNSPPSKQPRTEPPAVPALPHERESYAAAVKEYGTEDVEKTNGHDDHVEKNGDGEDKQAEQPEEQPEEQSAPAEADTTAVKDAEGAPTAEHHKEEHHHEDHDGESAAEKAKVVQGFSFADAVKE